VPFGPLRYAEYRRRGLTKTSDAVAEAALQLCRDLERVRFSAPVACVYNPLEYAWGPHSIYLKRYARQKKRVLYLGMNPGPWGMAQTGIPFGEVAAVREWLKIEAPVGRPDPEHPKRPIQGLACTRSEVSGKRLWGLFAALAGTPEAFFQDQFVANFCPLVFMDAQGRNVTPDKLPAAEAAPLREACDRHLVRILEILQPKTLVGVGQFAETCLLRASEQLVYGPCEVIRILHPSPASPAANRGWAGLVEKVLVENGIWPKK